MLAVIAPKCSVHGKLLVERLCSERNLEHAGWAYSVCPDNPDTERWKYRQFNQPLP